MKIMICSMRCLTNQRTLIGHVIIDLTNQRTHIDHVIQEGITDEDYDLI